MTNENSTNTDKIKEKDFIEIDFVGRVKDGEVFDSTKKEDLEKLHEGHDHHVDAKPFTFSVGQGMFMKSLDEFLTGKEVGKEYDVELEPEKAFGKRDPSSVQRIPSNVFKEQKINPYPGAMFNFDGRIGKVLTVSGGRVIVDFNHALAGKDVVYKINVLRKVTDLNEKIKAVNNFLFKKDLDFEVNEKDKKILIDTKGDNSTERMVELFKDKYKEILGFDVEAKKNQKEEKESKADSNETEKGKN
ncbi:MAG: peptidylprolyl isomerase [Candidatus Pacearchaeota archaeon]